MMLTVTNTSLSDKQWILLFAPIYLGWRIWLAARLPISDCDETFNYFEPLHFLLYGHGLQTWEYAHQYALRTYAYLVPLQWASQYAVQPVLRMGQQYRLSHWIFSMLTGIVPTISTASHQQMEKMALFAILRAVLGGFTAVSELIFLASPVVQQSTRIPTFWLALVFLLTIHHSAAALLPSSTWTAAWLLAASTMHRPRLFVVVCVVATLTTGWPFGAVAVLPMALYVLHQQRDTWVSFIGWIVMVTCGVQCGVMMIDYSHYGTWTAATWNIFVYNAGESNDTLYGVEPLSYYIKNLFLNLNVVALLGVCAIPVYGLAFWMRKEAYNMEQLAVLLSLPAWFLITLPRPHKEERFLFPVYPVLCFGAVLVVDTVLIHIMSLCTRPPLQASDARRQDRILYFLHGIVWVPSIMVSLSRMVALYKYYAAPLTVYAALKGGRVCTCGEWYRFPSSFYLETPHDLGFLPSSFRGQLPQPFSMYGSKVQSQSVLQPFNDQNLEETDRYMQDVHSCQWVVDLSDGECLSKHFFFLKDGELELEVTIPFLDAVMTSSTLHRAFYIPWLHERATTLGSVSYRSYELYRLAPKQPSSSSTMEERDTLEAE